jgi:hypothetical protein
MSAANCATHVWKAWETVFNVNDLNVIFEGATVQPANASQEQLSRAIRAAGDYKGGIGS